MNEKNGRSAVGVAQDGVTSKLVRDFDSEAWAYCALQYITSPGLRHPTLSGTLPW